jgi:2-hydroxychromene-2-carboxylate isomerase
MMHGSGRRRQAAAVPAAFRIYIPMANLIRARTFQPVRPRKMPGKQHAHANLELYTQTNMFLTDPTTNVFTT